MRKLCGFVLASYLVLAAPSVKGDPLKFTGCSPAQKSMLIDQFLVGKQLALDALDYMQNHADENPAPFKKWFDANFLGANRSVVASWFERIVGGLAKDFDVNCAGTEGGCKTTTFAYVHPEQSQPGERVIYFCPYYWLPSASMSVFSTEAGVFVHEMSHFATIANTIDVMGADTPETCHALAATNPNAAIGSSYNYQFFAEDHPLAGGPGGCIHCRIGAHAAPPPVAFFAVASLLLVYRRRRRGRREVHR